MKLGVSQANTVVHIHPTDEGDSAFGAPFHAVTRSAYHLASNYVDSYILFKYEDMIVLVVDVLVSM